VLSSFYYVGNQVGVSFLPVKWFCPSSQFRGFGEDGGYRGTVYQPMYVYGMNAEGVDTGASLDATAAPWAAPAPTGIEWHAFKRKQVRHSAEKLMFVDSMYPVVNIWGSGVSPGWKGQASSYDVTGERTATNGGLDASRTTAWRHEKGANVCFFDGHVEWVPRDRIYLHDASGAIVANESLWKVLQ